MTLSALFLLMAAVPGPAVSPLNPDGHREDWYEVVDSERGIAWVDQAWQGARAVDGQTYPVFLLRIKSRQSDTQVQLADMQLVVDCNGKRMGLSAYWTESSGTAPGETSRIDKVQMNYAADPLGPDDIAVFEWACEAGWTP